MDEEHKKMEEEAGSPLRKKKEKVPFAITQKMTKRPHLKIMAKIREKILITLREKLGEEFQDHIVDALGDK